MKFRIIGKYRGREEEIDNAGTWEEAEYMREEYALAFGSEWEIRVEKELS